MSLGDNTIWYVGAAILLLVVAAIIWAEYAEKEEENEEWFDPKLFEPQPVQIPSEPVLLPLPGPEEATSKQEREKDGHDLTSENSKPQPVEVSQNNIDLAERDDFYRDEREAGLLEEVLARREQAVAARERRIADQEQLMKMQHREWELKMKEKFS